LLIGAYARYAYEKNKLTGMMMTMQTSYQQQLDSAKMMAQQSSSQGQIVMMAQGGYATGKNSMSLYTFDKDTTTQRNCTGNCLVTWPPYMVSGTVPATMPDHI